MFDGVAKLWSTLQAMKMQQFFRSVPQCALVHH
uniref:Uncharacterized protein n=1 Tax=Anguilla anguilla TaxID=7936 RepID=A0A0E9UI49_ANGAN